jgi:hypothetical protein
MSLFDAIYAPRSLESMKFPVKSLLTGNFPDFRDGFEPISRNQLAMSMAASPNFSRPDAHRDLWACGTMRSTRSTTAMNEVLESLKVLAMLPICDVGLKHFRDGFARDSLLRPPRPSSMIDGITAVKIFH